MPHVVVVGAGISGLSVAFRLQQRVPPVAVTVLEEANHVGGVIATLREDGFQLETGPNGFLDSKPTTQSLSAEVGLADQLVAASAAAGRHRYLWLGGRLRELPTGPGSLLRSNLLSWRGKLALVAERFRRPGTVADESIDAFVRRRAGAEAADVMADALVTGIYAGDPTLLSLPACFPRLAEFERVDGSVIKGFARASRKRRAEAAARGEPYRRGSRLWSFGGGLSVLVDALAERLGTAIQRGARVRRLSRVAASEPAGWRVDGEGQERWFADAVVLTCPAYRQAELLADLDATLAERIGAIPYNRVAVVGLGYRAADVAGSVNGFGFIAPQRTRGDVLGVQWCSSIFAGRAPPGHILLRGMCGGWHRGEVVEWDDDRLVAAMHNLVAQAMGVTGLPVFRRVVRWPRAIPQYLLGHLDLRAWLDGRLRQHPGLFLGGNAYRGVALNDCTEQGVLMATEVGRYLSRGTA